MIDFHSCPENPKFKVQGLTGRKKGGSRFRPCLIGWAAGAALSLLCFSGLWAEEIRYDSGGRRDPFIPLVGPGGIVKYGFKAAGQFKVEGIIFDPIEGSYALINGEFIKEGDSIGNAQLISILKDRVVLSVNKDEQVVWLREEIVEE